MSLVEQARLKLEEGKRLEAANDLDGAMAAYQEAKRLQADVQDPAFELEYVKAMQRIIAAANAQRLQETRDATSQLLDIAEGLLKQKRQDEANLLFDKAKAFASEFPDLLIEVEQRWTRITGQ